MLRRKLNAALHFLELGSKGRKPTVLKKDQDSSNQLGRCVSEVQVMLNGLAIETNNNVFVIADENTVTNADVRTMALTNREWLASSILPFIMQ